MTAIFKNILEQALELNLQRQALNAKYRHNLEPHQWMQEFGTVRIQMGRGVGHTTAICQLACKDDLVVAGSAFQLMTMNENSVKKPAVALALNLLDNTRLRGRTFDRIWVDDASLKSSEEIRNVYVTALMHRANQIILVG
ncbi:hypothetical protein [Xanthomonas phage BUDD]|nr:hypothetical protein [Xanthomonas phage BUDD]